MKEGTDLRSHGSFPALSIAESAWAAFDKVLMFLFPPDDIILHMPDEPSICRFARGTTAGAEASLDAWQRVTLRRSDIIVPIFVREGKACAKSRRCRACSRCRSTWRAAGSPQAAGEGFGAYPDLRRDRPQKKDATGSPALDPNNIVCQLLREATQAEAAR